jgi:hypothetical protein
VYRTVSDEAPKVPPYDAVPSRSLALVKLAMELARNIDVVWQA